MTGQYGHHNKIFQFPNRRGGPVPGSPEDDISRHLTFAQVLNNAARQGARAAVYVGNSNAEVEAAVRNALDDSMGLDPDAVDVRISMLSPEGQEQYQVRNLSENEQGGAIRVTVSVDYGLIGSATNLLGLQAGRLSSYAVMRRQR